MVYDLDDALHVRPPHHHAASHGWHDFSKAERIARQARAVVVSSAVLEEWARPLARAVIRIPTAVDTQRFRPLGRIDSEGTSARNYSDEKPVGDESKGTTARARHPNERSSGRAVPVVGWTGTAGNFAHLASIRPALAAAAREVPFVLRVVGERAFEPWDEPRTEFIPWSLEDEAEQVARFDIGLMPLIDSEYARAKAGYKALVYMACGVPPVVSPVGTNREILDDGMEGFFAETLEEWKDRLVLLLRDAQLRARLGAAARARVVAEHSQQVLFPRWASLLEELGRET